MNPHELDLQSPKRGLNNQKFHDGAMHNHDKRKFSRFISYQVVTTHFTANVQSDFKSLTSGSVYKMDQIFK